LGTNSGMEFQINNHNWYISYLWSTLVSLVARPLVFTELNRTAFLALSGHAKAVPLELLGEQIGLSAPLAAAWLTQRLDGRFLIADNYVALQDWTRVFPPKGEIIVALDLEATNGDPVREDIIEIGAVRIDEQGLREFQSFVPSKRPINPFVQRMTGINSAMIEDAPPIEETLFRLESFLEGATLVVHNAGFDAALLAREFAKLGRKLPNPIVDTINLAQAVLPGRRKRGLETLSRLYNVPQAARHRALDDARVTLAVAKHLYFSLVGSRELTLKELHDDLSQNPPTPSSKIPASSQVKSQRRRRSRRER
jgi:DNA polymerase III subunit epsilon